MDLICLSYGVRSPSLRDAVACLTHLRCLSEHRSVEMIKLFGCILHSIAIDGVPLHYMSKELKTIYLQCDENSLVPHREDNHNYLLSFYYIASQQC